LAAYHPLRSAPLLLAAAAAADLATPSPHNHARTSPRKKLSYSPRKSTSDSPMMMVVVVVVVLLFPYRLLAPVCLSSGGLLAQTLLFCSSSCDCTFLHAGSHATDTIVFLRPHSRTEQI